jgi:hypothetical protein
MADKTPLSELRNKLKLIGDVSRSKKGEDRKGPKAGNKPPQVARDIRKNFRKTV